MTDSVTESGSYKNFTASVTLAPTNSHIRLLGIFVATTSGGTIQLLDGANNVVSAFTPLAGKFYPLPFEFMTSLVITVTGTLDATASYSV